VKLGFAVQSVCRKYFGLEAEYLGYVNHDESVRHSVSARRPVIEFHSKSDASIYLQRIARKLVAGPAPLSAPAQAPLGSPQALNSPQALASRPGPGAGR